LPKLADLDFDVPGFEGSSEETYRNDEKEMSPVISPAISMISIPDVAALPTKTDSFTPSEFLCLS
jgi:hypothetical protein